MHKIIFWQKISSKCKAVVQFIISKVNLYLESCFNVIYYIVSFSWFSNWKKELMFRHCTGNNISYFILKWKNVFCKNHPVCISDFKTWTCGIMQSQIAHPPPQRGPLWPIYIYFFQKLLPYMRHYNLLLNWNWSWL